MMNLRVKKLSKTAVLPEKAHDTDLGYDIFSDEEVSIKSGEKIIIKTGIALKCPDGYGLLLKDKSSMGARGVHVLAGVIDENYIGEIKVIMINFSNNVITIEKGQKITQGILIPCVTYPIQEVEELNQTDRGSGGFGSTGKNTIKG